MERCCARCGGPVEGRRKYCSDDCRYNRSALGPNRAAAERTIAAMRESGVLETVDDATVAAFLTLAAAVDQPDAKADFWREYRAFTAALKEAAAGGSDDDTQAFLITVQTPRVSGAPLGHPPKP